MKVNLRHGMDNKIPQRSQKVPKKFDENRRNLVLNKLNELKEYLGGYISNKTLGLEKVKR